MEHRETGDRAEDVETVRRLRDSMFDAFNAADVDAFVAVVADDVVWMSHAGPPPILGRDAVRSSYREFFERGPFVPTLTCRGEETVVSGEWAFDRGTWEVVRTYKGSDRRERLDSSYVMIWRRDREGRWELARFIWNGSPVPLEVPEAGRQPP